MIHPALRELFLEMGRESAFDSIVKGLAKHPHQALSGLTLTAKALYSTLLWLRAKQPLLIVTDGAQEAELLFAALQTFFEVLVADATSPRPQLLPALDALPSQGLSPHPEISEQRAAGLYRLASGQTSITVTPVGSLLLRTYPAAFYQQLALTLKLNDEISLDDLAEHLRRIGYTERDPVEMVGEFSLRGGIVDIFPAESEQPLRIEFFGDAVDSMRRFDVITQRSVLKVERAVVLPLVEHPKPSNPVPAWEFTRVLTDPRESNLLALAGDALVVLDEPEQVQSAAGRLWKRLDEPQRERVVDPADIFLPWNDVWTALGARRRVTLRQVEVLGESEADRSADLQARTSPAFHGNLPNAIAETRKLVEAGYKVVYFAPAVGEVERLADLLNEYSVPFQLALSTEDTVSQYHTERARLFGSAASTMLTRGNIRKGTTFLASKLAIVGSEDLFDTSDLIAEPGINKRAAAAFAADIADLKPGDYVVHTTHGVGRFVGIKEIPQGDQKGDFLVLEYAGESKLYVPMTRLDLVQKFRGAGEGTPPLDRMGGATWTKTKSRVKAKMRDMADELLKLYAERRMSEGFAFSLDSNWQREFEDAFPYTPTKDQLYAVSEIKRDMERAQPMDRLLCGDVGFGKTEVAMRAAFKALGDGKQVAVLTPTTVLTFQHYETFKRRFASFPVNIEMLSRFRSPNETKKILEDLGHGKIDILIGTHRLLSKDVEFIDLGLLIVDEEQRFGVRHKERLKQLRHNIDVLTMSATPIPRTLHMSLLGLRDMSVIETPPKDRLSIQTVVSHWNADLIRSAMELELGRGGQVFFVHNRVETIYQRAAWIQEQMPGITVGVGHGQLGEKELEKVLLGFMRHEFDVFVCTTIIENGIDIPLANTILIENAERYGLSELYQLRGRVGRSNRRAYSYLLVPENKDLTEIARKRLAALKEFSDLGAGFKIAALDLELRGSGNLLGGEQHGQMDAVGYDTYLKLLEDTVRELKGEEVPPEIHSTITLGLDIRIPASYIAEELQRLRAYKKIASLESQLEANKTLEEFADRYGPPPDVVKTLTSFSVVRATAQKLGIESIDRRQGYFNIKVHTEARLRPEGLMELVTATPGAQFTPAGILRLPADAYPPTNPQKLLGYLEECLHALDFLAVK